MPVARFVSTPHLAFITPEKLWRVAPSLATWGAGTGAAVLLFGSDVPIMKKDVLTKIPVIGNYWALPGDESKDQE
ncbi:ubiquinol-cytochrome-c reductase complex subunit-domain-containing protein [Mycotypha africana]|uniref:ubiquinol-cytochrome-c reductase complex subunit-domain-containing protein n=1 Tax=Mycotypha africana TaxID=64632 RepID=UPI002300A220|nr:ubiquinol-cytochrome-c reductase complex subunit-domain-containing protein [Mycotypha africana]KAI8973518.1 ubiquinol-cytochrome-c reductase complex subunit-domain-containing protein [Mycotypha africana]